LKFACPLLAISNLEISKKFYKEVLGQKVTLDLGWNVAFSGGFAIQLNFAELISIDNGTVMKKPHNFELVFEEDDFDAFVEHLKKFDNIEYVHQPRKYDWQQRVVRIYDPDKHIIEIGESMDVIAKRYLSQGLSTEETAKIIQHPVEFVKSCI
jgi:catechol 2,3-dioxygenase-like lactoylglutathione lyase family enzyme